MKSTVSFTQFTDEFMQGQYKNNFTYEGLKALYDYLEEFENSTGEELEFDVVAIACDFTEYKDIEEFMNEYKPEVTTFEEWREENPDSDREEYLKDITEELEKWITDRTQLILLDNYLDNGFIVGCF